MAAEAGGTAQAGADVQALVRDGALAGRWVLDPGASRVEFHVRHFWGAVTVRGWFERLEGDVEPVADGLHAGDRIGYRPVHPGGRRESSSGRPGVSGPAARSGHQLPRRPPGRAGGGAAGPGRWHRVPVARAAAPRWRR